MISRRLSVFLLLCAILFSTIGPASAAGVDQDGKPAVLRDGDGVVVEWRTPPAVETQAGGAVRLAISGYANLERPGEPQLPFSSLLLAVPPGAEPSLEILHLQDNLMKLSEPLSLAPQPAGVRRAPDGQVIGGDFEPTGSPPAKYSLQAAITAPVTLEEIGIQRGVGLVRLVFYPALPLGGGQAGVELRMIENIRLRVSFNFPNEQRPASQPLSGPFREVLEQIVANPWDLAARSDTDLTPALPEILQAASSTAAIEVQERGLTGVSYEALAGVNFPLQSQPLRLQRGEVEIPFEIEGDTDSLLEPGERLLFYAAPRFNRYSEHDVYLLSPSSAPSQPMSTRSANPTGLTNSPARVGITFEENRIYTPDCYCAPLPPGRDGDRWVWSELNRPAIPEASFLFDLPNIDTNRVARLQVWVIGFTDLAAALDHRLQVVINGRMLGQLEWDGKQAKRLSLDVPAGWLKEAGNSLSLSLPGGLSGVEVEGVWLDAFRVTYLRNGNPAAGALEFFGDPQASAYPIRLSSTAGLRAYDVTDPDQPQRLKDFTISADVVTLGDPPSAGNRRYWIGGSSAILDPARLRMLIQLPASVFSNDYLIIAPSAFHQALGGLIELRRTQGLSAGMVDVQAIYDVFGAGLPEPTAIHDFLAQAYASPTPPTYVLLAGDGTSDPKRYLDSSAETFIPPFLEDVDPWAGEAAADNRFATLDGTDLLPDLLIGRLPANSVEETQAVVNKIVQYEMGSTEGIWNNQGLFVADDEDASGPFAEINDTLIRDNLARFLIPKRFYYQSGTPAEELRARLLSAWSEGAGLVLYSGHSSIHQWGAEVFIHLNDVATLANGARLPVLLEMTCFTGAFQVPGFRTLDEALLVHPSGGAVAVWGSTGLGVSTGHVYLAQGFLNTLASGRPARLGSAVLAGKLALRTVGIHLDLLDTYTILGDPAMALRMERGSQAFIPSAFQP